jgi:DNA-binding transcriptional MerR regulator
MSKSDLDYSGTTGSVSREAGCLPETVRRLADEGLLDFRRLADGTRVFQADAAAHVRMIMAERRSRQARKVTAA